MGERACRTTSDESVEGAAAIQYVARAAAALPPAAGVPVQFFHTLELLSCTASHAASARRMR